MDGGNAWDLQLLNLCVGSPWNATARSTQQKPTIQQKDESESGRRAKRVYLRQNILDKYGRTAGCPGCVGIGQHTEVCRARIEQEMVDRGDARKLETSGNQQETVPELDVSLRKRETGEPDINPGGASSSTAHTPKRRESEQGSSAGNENLLAGCIAAVVKLLCDPLSGKFPEDELNVGRELELRNMLNFDAFELVDEQENTLMTWCGLMNGEVTGEVTTLCATVQGQGSEMICLRERQIRFSSSICWPKVRVARISDHSLSTLVLLLRTLEQMRKYM